MGFRNSFRAFPWWARLGIVGITVFGIGIIVYDQVVLDGTGGHEVAPFEPSLTQVIDVCPSASVPEKWGEDPFDALVRAAEDYTKMTDCGVALPTIQRSECEGHPEVGHMQIRDCGDLVVAHEFQGLKLYSGGCPEGYVDTVEHHPVFPGSGVTYWQVMRDRPYTPHHILGHIIGIGHTTAATSWMNPVAGDQPTFISCDQ